MRGTAPLIAALSRLLLCPVLVLTSLLAAQHHACAQNDYRVAGIHIAGNSTLGTSDIVNVMSLKSVSWFNRAIMGDAPSYFDQDMMSQDVAAIKKYYQREGFLRAFVAEPTVSADPDDETVDIQIGITENEPVLLDTVSHIVVGTPQSLCESVWDAMADDLTLRSGERFRDQHVIDDEASILRTFSENGFAHVFVQRNLTVDTVTNRASMRWVVLAGHVSVFGNVRYVGATRTPEDAMNPRLAFHAGEVYNSARLNETRNDLYTLGMFNVVTPVPRLQDPASDSIGVTIIVKEAKTPVLKISAGYGSEEKFRVRGDLTFLGFLGDARKLGLRVMHSAIEPYNVTLTFTQPDLLIRLFRFQLSPYALKEIEPAYTAERVGANATFDRVFGYNNDYGLTYTYEYVVQDTSGAPELVTDPGFQERYRKSALTAYFRRDNSAPAFDPLAGVFAGLSVTYSGLGWADASDFLRGVVELRGYTEFMEDFVAAGKLKIGMMLSYEGDGFVPIEERFFAGGDRSVRGYPRSSLGPIDATGTPTGGNSLLETGAELRIRVIGQLRLGLFCDAGYVWAPTLTYKLNELAYGIGAGIRWGTPIGPVRLDAAWPAFGRSGPPTYLLTIGNEF